MNWIPFHLTAIYLCKDMELHQAKAWIWFGRPWFKRDNIVVNAQGLKSMMFQLSMKAGYDERDAKMAELTH